VALAAHVGGLLAGAMLSATALLCARIMAGPLPRPAMAGIAVMAVLGLAAEPTIGVPGSRWMVPKDWGRLTPTWYAVAFGLALGAGIVTVAPSTAIYVVLATAQAAPVWWHSFAVVLAFATTAAMAPILLTARSIRHGSHPIHHVALLGAWSSRAAPAELVMASALATELLLVR
jgi:hypothetical protein